MIPEIYVNIPYHYIDKYLSLILEKRYFLEVYFESRIIDNLSLNEIKSKISLLIKNGIKIRIHAPFMDLRPASSDEKIRNISKQRYLQSIDIAYTLGSPSIVVHPGYNPLEFDDQKEQWLERSIETWKEVLKIAEEKGISIFMENIYEETPNLLRSLFQEINSSYFGFCFDIGHFNVYSKTDLEQWFLSLGQYLREIHLHDNHGTKDEHLTLGEGNIDFEKLLSLIKGGTHNLVYTLEIHQPSKVEKGFNTVSNWFL